MSRAETSLSRPRLDRGKLSPARARAVHLQVNARTARRSESYKHPGRTAIHFCRTTFRWKQALGIVVDDRALGVDEVRG